MIPILILAIEGVNILLLLLLLYVYIGTYRKVKNRFTLGLIFFSFAFLIKSVMLMGTLAFILKFIEEVPHSGDAGAPLILLIVNAIECAGLVILLKISWD